MALTSWNDIINKPAAIEKAASLAEDVQELELSVADLSASVLSLGEDVGEIAQDVLELTGDVDDLSETGNITISNLHIGIIITHTVKYGKLRVIKCYAADAIAADEKWFDVEDDSIPQSNVSDTAWLLTDATNSATKTLVLGTNGSATCSSAVFRGGFTLVYTV